MAHRRDPRVQELLDRAQRLLAAPPDTGDPVLGHDAADAIVDKLLVDADARAFVSSLRRRGRPAGMSDDEFERRLAEIEAAARDAP